MRPMDIPDLMVAAATAVLLLAIGTTWHWGLVTAAPPGVVGPQLWWMPPAGPTYPPRVFCATQAKNLKCAWASDYEVVNTTTCAYDWCNDPLRNRHMPYNLAPPLEISNVNKTPVEALTGKQSAQIISLACTGRVVVRSVFQIVSVEPWRSAAAAKGNACPFATLVALVPQYGGPEPVVRCELELPLGKEPDWQRALRSKEVNCRVCASCMLYPNFGPYPTSSNCSRKVDQWYADSYTTTVNPCPPLASGGFYLPNIPRIDVEPGVVAKVAKFEVCQDPSCFNMTYEGAKLARAQQCDSSGGREC